MYMYLEQELPTHTRTRSLTENTYPYQRHIPVSAHYIDAPPPSILMNHKNVKFISEQSSTLSSLIFFTT